jgi:hypothetical protein
MLSPFNANRLRLCLQREKEHLAHALGRKRRAHEKAREKAQRACAYLQQAGRLLVSQGLPAAWEIRVQPANTHRPGAVRIEMTLDGAALGRVLINDDWLIRYMVADRSYLFFGLALRAAGRYLARQVAYYQLLRQRMQPFAEWLREEAGRPGRRHALEVTTHYNCEQEWDIRYNYLWLRFSANGKAYTLRIYGDRFLWDGDGNAAQRTLFAEEEVLQALDEALCAATPGSRILPEWLLLLGTRVRSVIHLR